MLRVVGRKVNAANKNIAFLILNEDQYNAPAQWVDITQLKALLKKYNFSNLNHKLECTDGKEGSYSSIPIYSTANTIQSKKKGLVLWAYKDTQTIKGYTVYLPNGIHNIGSTQMKQFVETYGLANASYNRTTGGVKLLKGHLRTISVNDNTQPKASSTTAEFIDTTSTLVGGTPSKVAEIVTNKVLEQLENGIIPWQKPWVGNHGVYSYETQKPYQGVNVFLLSEPGEYITYNAYKKLKKVNPDISMRDNIKWEFVVYWHVPKVKKADTKNENEKDDENKDATDTEDEKLTKKARPILKYYRVAHIKYFNGIPSKRPSLKQIDFKPVELAEKTLKTYTTKYHIKLEQVEGSDQAYYRPSQNYICVPMPEQFSSVEEYYQTVYHEALHSTGKTLNRLQNCDFASQSYSKEELIAEIGACIVLANLGIEPTLNNSTSYIAGWAKALRNNKNILPVAAQQAQKGAELILACRPVEVQN